MFIKKSVFNALNGYDVHILYAEDQEIVERAFKNKYKVKLLRKPVVYVSSRRIKKEGVSRFVANVGKSMYYYLRGWNLDDENNKTNKNKTTCILFQHRCL